MSCLSWDQDLLCEAEFPCLYILQGVNKVKKGGYKMLHHGCPQGEAQYLLNPSSACPSLGKEPSHTWG